jgi:hypothetical protein
MKPLELPGLDNIYRLAQLKRDYHLNQYKVRMSHYEDEKRFIDFFTDSRGKMRRLVLNTRTKKLESIPLDE